MDAPIQFLRDIRGLDSISWWPPALGWWLAAIVGLLVIAGGVWLWRTAPYTFEGWRWDARQRLKRLRRQLDTQQPKKIAGELSELLRRIAIARCGRHPCAGLTGEAWLTWLTDNDPTGFDWRDRGHILLELPYAPPETLGRKEALNELIGAALGWVITKNKRFTTPMGRTESRAENSPKEDKTATDV